ncbi:MAG: translation initiation factor IF-2 N-terminal domain-containing protein, partial [Nitriliruptorales bacterium]
MSDTVRVYELARETGLENKEVLRRLAELEIDASTHSSSVPEHAARRFLESLGRKDAQAEEDERRRAEEAERLAAIDLEEVAAAQSKKARKVLPPHLREQQEAEEARRTLDEAVAAEVAADTAEKAPEVTAVEEPAEASTPEAEQPAADAGA